MEKIPRIGTGILIIKDWKILIWKRTNTSLWNNKYWLPWGHLDFWESIVECWIREAKEETWLDIDLKDIHILDFTEDIFEGKHYVTFFMIVETFPWTISTPEPDKHKEWIFMKWEDIKKLDDNLLKPLNSLMKKYPDFNPFT